MIGKMLAVGSLMMGLSLGGVAVAQHEGHAHGTKEKTSAHEVQKDTNVTIQGHVIDIVCYTRHAAVGEKHLKCATTCAQVGIPVGILEEGTGEVFLVFPPGHKNPNEAMMPYLEKDVTVIGTVHRKGGIKGVTIQEIVERKG